VEFQDRSKGDKKFVILKAKKVEARQYEEIER
jgi:hypothetical protein